MSHLMQPNSFHLGRCLLGEAVSCLETAGGASVHSPRGLARHSITQLPFTFSSVRAGESGEPTSLVSAACEKLVHRSHLPEML